MALCECLTINDCSIHISENEYNVLAIAQEKLGRQNHHIRSKYCPNFDELKEEIIITLEDCILIKRNDDNGKTP
jgi:16S rRNA C967 or C1407 C5-methylase (RsmB/RsmF family)